MLFGDEFQTAAEEMLGQCLVRRISTDIVRIVAHLQSLVIVGREECSQVRFRQVGKIGIADLRYMKATATYESVIVRSPNLSLVDSRRQDDAA